MLNPDAVGITTSPARVEWTSDFCLLYALGVGAGPAELAYTTENTTGLPQRILPTLPVVHGAGTEHFAHIGEFDWSRVVHARQRLDLHGGLRVGDVVDVATTITGMLDKGSAAILQTRTTGTRPGSDRPVFTSDSDVFIGGAGGWGGERGRRDSAPEPTRQPDHVRSYHTRPEQALLYRLVGDRHPLHSDPGFAAAAGFRRPILHGLCTFGFAGRALLALVAGDEPDRIRGMEARFVAPAEPGNELVVEIWTGKETLFRVRTGSGTVVLTDGRCRTGPPDGQATVYSTTNDDGARV